MPGIEVIDLPANHRCTPQIVAAGAAVLRAGGQARAGDVVAARRPGRAHRRRRRRDARGGALVAAFVRSLDPGDVRTGDVAVLARTNDQLTRLVRGARRRRRARRRRATARQARRSPRRSRRRRACRRRPACGGGPTTCSTARRRRTRPSAASPPPCSTSSASSRSATAPRCATWLATMRPFADDEGGVELLTFHAAKGREWTTVVVTGVETGSVPHRSATTAAAQAEEARLLHVAVTRASDRLVITWAGRRGGYRRQPSPLLAEVDTATPAAVRAAARPAAVRPRRATAVSSGCWRGATAAARAAMILPAEVCTDADLARHRRRRPGNARRAGGGDQPRPAHRRPPVPRHPRRPRRVRRGQIRRGRRRPGAWSLGDGPLRALRSMTHHCDRSTTDGEARTRSMRIPRPSWKSPRR